MNARGKAAFKLAAINRGHGEARPGDDLRLAEQALRGILVLWQHGALR
jgi:hypothetical protein